MKKVRGQVSGYLWGKHKEERSGNVKNLEAGTRCACRRVTASKKDVIASASTRVIRVQVRKEAELKPCKALTFTYPLPTSVH